MQRMLFATVCFLLLYSTTLAASPLYQSNSVSYLYGEAYLLNPDNAKRQHVITLEHASGWQFGDVFAFIDLSDFPDATSDRHTYYGEASVRFSLGKLSDNNVQFGIINDFLIDITHERGEVKTANALLYGPSFDLAIPGFDRFAMSVYYRDEASSTGLRDGQIQITPMWAVSFPLGKSTIVFDGYFDWVINEKTALYQTSHFHFNPQLKYDLGQLLNLGERRFYVGIEYDYWSNKYGLENTPEIGSNQNAVSFLLTAYF